VTRRGITRRACRAAVLLACLAAGARAQTTALDSARSAQQRIDVLERDFDRRGLPTELLKAKVAEGVAKGATPMRIADAVTQLARRVDLVARLLAPSASASEMHAGAEALALGVPGGSLRTLHRAVGRRSSEPYFLFVIRLMRRGVSQDQALRAVRSLIDRQAAPGTLLALADDLARDVASGIAPDDALSDRMTRLVGGNGLTGGFTADGFSGIQNSGSSRGRP
jgi:hypothetical protein